MIEPLPVPAAPPSLLSLMLEPIVSITALNKISNVKELSALLHLDYSKELSYALHRMKEENKYKNFSIKKKSGDERVISSPNRLISKIQTNLLPYLEEIYKAPSYVHGFAKGKSIKKNAENHVGKRFIVNIDIKDFFPSIKFKRVSGILQSSRYQLSPKVATAIAQIVCHDGHLPTGAPTSGIISNIVCGPLDKALIALARENKLTYTRYADDITFSTSNPLNLRAALGVSLEGAYISHSVDILSEEFRDIFSNNWFEINEKKVWVTTKHVRQKVTGLVVNKKVNVTSTYFKNLKAAIHSIEKYGLKEAEDIFLEKYAQNNASLKSHIEGKLSFLGHIANYNAKYSKLANKAKSIFPDVNFKIPYNDKFKSTYVIESKPSGNQGTAVHIGDGYFLTAHHILDAEDFAIHLSCPTHFDKPVIAEIVNSDPKHDILILKSTFNEEYRPKIEISSKKISIHETTNIIGFPNYISGNSVTNISANIIAERRLIDVKKLDVDKPLYKGMSGGPVLNDAGHLVGLVYSGPKYGFEEAPLSVAFTPLHEHLKLINEMTLKTVPIAKVSK